MWILVTGPKGAGKSTFSYQLGKRLGWKVLSADDLVNTLYKNQKVRTKIRDLMKERGIDLPENFSKFDIKRCVISNPKIIIPLGKLIGREVQKILKREIRKALPLVIEIPFPRDFIRHIPPSFHPILTVVLTDPFSKLSHRIKERDGDLFLLKKTIRYHAQK